MCGHSVNQRRKTDPRRLLLGFWNHCGDRCRHQCEICRHHVILWPKNLATDAPTRGDLAMSIEIDLGSRRLLLG